LVLVEESIPLLYNFEGEDRENLGGTKIMNAIPEIAWRFLDWKQQEYNE